ncbi:MAG: CHASE2 domain-containing protein [Leptolyngbya sp. SIO4C5]|nr:CHASE2 domain-containing protein [Leptolyngbya sp. SIO4C5]
MYRLKVYEANPNCIFELTWGQGQCINARVPYPKQLKILYDRWHNTYLGFYKQAVRGRVEAAGQVVSSQSIDWHTQLVQAEAKLLSEFHRWLKHESLFDLRKILVIEQQKKVTNAQFQRKKAIATQSTKASLFLTCASLELERLPWETWEIGADLRGDTYFQIVRSPATIRSTAHNRRQFRRGKTRVLAILGDDTGLDFEGDRAALDNIPSLEIRYEGWKCAKDSPNLRETICQAIAEPQGWDILFFAGHSNEAQVVDGLIYIAPDIALSMQELKPYIRKAQQQGLQFALFNSCSGLNIANSVVDLGLGQVAIMREPIHNAVAHRFLVQFLQRLGNYEDAQTALAGACQSLKLEQNLTYPSAYLIPSLFRHPDSVPYRIQPTGWRHQIKRWLPTKREAIAVSAIALISIPLFVQDWLIERRVLVQAVYRQMFSQQGISTAEPPVIIVQIDNDTLNSLGIKERNPIDRQLLADILAKLIELEATVVGFDYLLETPQANDTALNQVIQQGIEQQLWLVFITDISPRGDWLSIYSTVASSNWVLEGDAWVPFRHVLPRRSKGENPTPFSSQLALAYWLSQQARSGKAEVPVPAKLTDASLTEQVDAFVERIDGSPLPSRAKLHPITLFAYSLGQWWLQPLLDFSVPPSHAYIPISAADLLTDAEAILRKTGMRSLQDSVIIVAAGGYFEAGIAQKGEDQFPMPLAMKHWQQQPMDASITGGEMHGYMTHHILQNHLVVPIPDLWMVLVAVLLGKAIALYGLPVLGKRSFVIMGFLVGGSISYGLISLQLYISSAVLLPWLLPTLTVWIYVLSNFREDNLEL